MIIIQIRGPKVPKNQVRSKRLLSDSSKGGLVVSKLLSVNLKISFLNRISLFSYQASTLLSSQNWVDSVTDPKFQEKFLGYSQ